MDKTEEAKKDSTSYRKYRAAKINDSAMGGNRGGNQKPARRDETILEPIPIMNKADDGAGIERTSSNSSTTSVNSVDLKFTAE